MTRWMRTYGRGSVFLVSVLLISRVCVAGTTPPELLGTWEVTQVALDTKDQPHWRYEPNDPRILGRILVLEADGAIKFNFGREVCDHVDWASGSTMTLSALIGNSFPRPPHVGLTRNPTPQDFDLKLGVQTITPLSAVCSNADGSREKGIKWGNAWFVSVASEKLVVGYDGDTVLVLARVAPASPAKPSFSCKGSLDATETAICGSVVLAGYDRSVAAAYKRSRKRRETEQESVQDEQRQWVKERNRCGSDAACLEDRMRERIDALMQD
jgi:uncharacterized protein YecT (DUF1311 family)